MFEFLTCISIIKFLAIDICDETRVINQTGIILTSPGYPNSNYPPNLDCEKILRIEKKTTFRIEFIDKFYIQGSAYSDCKSDFIEIRNGELENSPLILKSCGITKPNMKILQGYSVKIKFVSDDSISWQKGFSLKVTSIEQSEGNQTY